MNYKEGNGNIPEINWPKSIELNSPDNSISLKTFTLDDAPEIFSLIDRNRNHLSQFNDRTSEKYPNLESVVSSITDPKNPNRRRFAIRNQENILVGSINITPNEDDSTSAEIGYYLGLEFTNKGYMTQAVKVLSDYAFNILSCHQVYEKIVNDNKKSFQVAENCGFVETEKTDQNETIFTLFKKNIN